MKMVTNHENAIDSQHNSIQKQNNKKKIDVTLPDVAKE